MVFKTALDALSSILVPAPCRVCGEALTEASAIPICSKCLSSFQRITEPMCQVCGHPFVSPAAMQTPRPMCRLCRKSLYAFDRARSFAVYSDALFEAIILMKYEEVTRLGQWFADRLTELDDFGSEAWRPDVIVPVPLHPERRRERGYNQAELVASPLAHRLRVPLKPGLLVRTKSRPPQLLLSRNQRWTSVRGAYATPMGRRVDNVRILLVDDVLTTGATLDSCARALKKSGAASVLALTVGRVVPKWSRVAAAPEINRPERIP